MLTTRGKGTIMTNLTNNNVNVTINGSNIEISGNGTLNFEDISRINFELATVTIKGFSYIDHSVSYCFENAFKVVIDESVKDFGYLHCKNAIVSHSLAWGEKDSYKTLSDIKDALRIRNLIDEKFVCNVYPAKFSSNWDGEIHGYLLTTSISEFVDNKFVYSDKHYYFVGVNKKREIFSKQETHIHQRLIEAFELLENEFVAQIHLCGDSSKNWLNDTLISKPTKRELQVFEENRRTFLVDFETKLILDMNKCLKENIIPIFKDKDLQYICKKYIPDFKAKVFERDGFGPLVVGFVANEKEYAI